MKRILIFSLLIASTFSYGQLQVKTPEEAHGYETIYKKNFPIREIRYISGKYIYLACTDNQYEKRMASIYLGETKESAIQTIKDLKNLKIKSNESLIVNDGFGNETTIFKVPINGICFKTEFVAGISCTFWTEKWDEIIQVLQDFTPNE